MATIHGANDHRVIISIDPVKFLAWPYISEAVIAWYDLPDDDGLTHSDDDIYYKGFKVAYVRSERNPFGNGFGPDNQSPQP